MHLSTRVAAALAAASLIALPGAAVAGAAPAAVPSPSATPSQTTSYSTVPADFSLTVSPTRLVVRPADLSSGHDILVVNRGRKAATVSVEKRDFTGGADGSLRFQEQAPFSASRWVGVSPASFTIAPGTARAVHATVTVPSGPEPGDHQVAVVFLVRASNASANVRVNRGVAVPVYVTVAGSTNDHTTVDRLSAPGFTLGGDVTLAATVHDQGTVHRDFRGRSALGVHGSGSAAPFPDFTVLRGGIRDVSTSWDPPLLCICHPSVTIVNADGTTSTATVRVVVIPLHLIAIALGVLLLLWLLYRYGRRRYRASVAAAAAGANGPGDA